MSVEQVLESESADMPIWPQRIPHDMTWNLTWDVAVGSRQLTAWAMARPIYLGTYILFAYLSIYLFTLSVTYSTRCMQT
jgi:hypothetical protein